MVYTSNFCSQLHASYLSPPPSRSPPQPSSPSHSPPGKYIFEQRAMRGHLMKCLEAGEFSMFPVRKIRRSSKRIKSTSIIKVYCDCRMPELPSSSMVQCTKRREWFHFLHVNVCGLNQNLHGSVHSAPLSSFLYSVPLLLFNTCNYVSYMFFTGLEKHFK